MTSRHKGNVFSRFAVLLLIVLATTWGPAQAEDALDRALTHARAQQQNAAGWVTAAQQRLAEAQDRLRLTLAVQADVRLAKDAAADAVAAEAVGEARANEREATRNLALARSLLATRSQATDDIASWLRNDWRPSAMLASSSGELRRYAKGATTANAHSIAPLQEGERIETGPNGHARLFTAGGDTEIDLGPNSSYTVTKDDVATGSFGALLESGFARVRTLVQHSARKFEVRTPTAAIAVRGTDYAVTASAAGTRLRVYEGMILASPPRGGPAQLVQAGEQLDLPAQGAWPVPERFDPAGSANDWQTDHALP